MSRHLMLLGALVVGVGIAAFLLLTPKDATYEPDGPGRGPESTEGGETDPDAAVPSEVPLPPGPARVLDLLGDGSKRAGTDLAARLGDPKVAKEIAAEFAELPNQERKAQAFLELLRTGAEAAREFIHAAVAGDYGPELRVPAILSLAGGGEAELARLQRLARAWDDPAIAGTAVLALQLAGTAEAQTILASLVETAPAADRRIALYDALAGGVPGLAIGTAFLTDLRGGLGALELRPDARFPAASGRVVTAIAAERDPSAMPAAARALARVPGPRAQDGILDLWGRIDGPEEEVGELRQQVYQAVAGDLRPGQAATLARMASTLTGPETLELRNQALGGIQDRSGPGLAEALRDWSKKEDDPGIRDGIAEALRRIEELPPEEVR